jgi:hypothetical protein
VLEFFTFEPGRVAAIEGVENARSIRGVHDLGLTFGVGDVLQPPTDDRSRHMHLIAHADTTDALEAVVRSAREAITVHYG